MLRLDVIPSVPWSHRLTDRRMAPLERLCNHRCKLRVKRSSEGVVRMRKAIFEISAAIAAGAIVLIVVAAGGSLSNVLKWVIVGATALAACGLAWWSSRRSSPGSTSSGLEIANRIRSDGNVDLEDIDVGTPGQDARIGNDIRSKRDTRIKGISVKTGKRSK